VTFNALLYSLENLPADRASASQTTPLNLSLTVFRVTDMAALKTLGRKELRHVPDPSERPALS